MSPRKITCPDCEGAGEHTLNATNPHGYGPDPQCDEPVDCETCMGSGEVYITPAPARQLPTPIHNALAAVMPPMERAA